MRELPHIIYVTHPDEDFSNLSWIDQLNSCGIKWIQLRIKEEDFIKEHPDLHFKATIMEIADLVRKKTKSLGMLLTINDWQEVAMFCEADGLHYGKKDTVQISDLEEINIVGGSMNKWEDLKLYDLPSLDYIGVGPFRDSSTKLDTQSVLGIEGYKKWLNDLGRHSIDLPLFAIGGLQLDDLKELKACGVYGVAVSSLFHKNGFDEITIKSAVQIMEKNG
ncbi:MAG: thiamine phosphate synthase [Bacteroidetes bacterium]|nr:thiamine phosphate synthase [Bacteroidota bacterium]